MKIEDEPLDEFYPRCALCGEQITGDGYQIEQEYYCDSCIEMCRIDGTESAESIRDAAYEDARETMYS